MLRPNLPTKRQAECLKITSRFQYNPLSLHLLELRPEVVCNLLTQGDCLFSLIRRKKMRVDEFAQNVVDTTSIIIATENGLVVPGALSIPILDDVQSMRDQYLLVSAHEWLDFTVEHVLENSNDSLVLESDVNEEIWNPGTTRIVILGVRLDHGDEDAGGEGAFGVA